MSNGILRSSAVMAVATFCSRILGLIRERVLATYFGASGVTDAFYVAFRIPNMLRDLFAESVFSSSFVPVFTEARQKSDEMARSLLWSSFVLLGVITSIISVLIIIFAPQIIDFLAPSFRGRGEVFELAVTLTKIMAPFLVMISLAALFMGALNTLKIFFVPSLAPALYNLLTILSIVFFYDVLSDRGIHPIFSAGIGAILGGLGQMAIQIPLLIKKKYGPTKKIKVFSSLTKKIINRVGIGTIGVAATEINLLINTILASSCAVGAVSWLQYAFRMFQFPIGILGVSIAGSNLVHFSSAWKKEQFDEAKEFLHISYLLCFFVMIPAMALLFSMSDESIHLLLESGKFDRTATLNAGFALKMYVIGLPCYGIYKIFGPVFFTLDRPKIPVFISVSTIIVNIIFCVLLTPHFGYSILALGVSVSMILNSSIQSVFLHKLLGLNLSFFLNLRILKFVVAGLATYYTSRYAMDLWFNYDDPFMTKILWFTVSGTIGAFTYLVLITVMGELKQLKKLLRR